MKENIQKRERTGKKAIFTGVFVNIGQKNLVLGHLRERVKP